MKITAKTLKGEVVNIEIDSEATVKIISNCRFLILRKSLRNKKVLMSMRKRSYSKEKLRIILMCSAL